FGKLISSGDLAGRIKAKDEAWDSGITFPTRTCEVPRLLLADLAPFVQLRRYAEGRGIAVTFLGATLSTADLYVLRAVWPEIRVREHSYPPRKIRRAAVLFVRGGRIGISSLVCQGRLRFFPLERYGRGFFRTKKYARKLFDRIKESHPSARFVIG